MTVLKNLSQNILDMPHYQSEIYRVRINYRRNLQNWLMPQLADEELQGYNYQQDGAPPHWHKEVRLYLNAHLLGRWVGDVADTDNTFCTWPPRSPDLTVCDFFLWGFVKDNVYVPPLPIHKVQRLSFKIKCTLL